MSTRSLWFLARFDRALVQDLVYFAAAPPVPEPLKAQLKFGGRLVIPVGERHQRLLVLTLTAAGFERTRVLKVEFTPMAGAAQK